MKQITCPKCGEQVPLEKMCKECGANLTELVEKAEAEERLRQEKQRQQEEEHKRKLAEEEQKRQRVQAEEEQKRKKAQAEKERIERLERERKIRRKRTAIILTVLVIAAAAVTAKIIYEKVRPDVWSTVSSGTEIPGVWHGKTVMDVSKAFEIHELLTANNIDFSAANVVLDLTIENTRDPEKIHTIIKADFTQLVKELEPYYAETAAPEGSGLTALMEKPSEEIDGYAAVSELNQVGQLFINHRKTKLKWQMNLGKMGIAGLASIECILEKTEGVKTYELGEFGEAGVVFYDKGSYSDGWRYLEVSPEFTRATSWSNGSVFVSNLKSEMGEGDFNTHAVIELIEGATAANVAASYHGGGKEDWYLGNNKEMEACYSTLVKNGGAKKRAKKIPGYVKLDRGFLGDAPSYIWTSEQDNAEKAFCLKLEHFLWDTAGDTSSTSVIPYKFMGMMLEHTYPVRPIRKF